MNMSRAPKQINIDLYRAAEAIAYDDRPLNPTHMHRGKHEVLNNLPAKEIEVKGVLTLPDGKKLLVYRFKHGYGFAEEETFDGIPLREWKIEEQRSCIYEKEDGQLVMIM
jgi:hypothetical protein